MPLYGRKILKDASNTVLDALLNVLSSRGEKGGTITIKTLSSVIDSIKESSDLNKYMDHVFEKILAYAEEVVRNKNRTNIFGRLMLEFVSDLFDSGKLNRDNIPNVFAFFHLVMGDQMIVLNNQCTQIVEDLRISLGEDFTWEDFYKNPDAQLVRWRALVRIANSFKHWDARVDWFIELMEYQPNTVSQGSNAFVVKKKHDGQETPQVFGMPEFRLFFTNFFKPLTDISSEDKERFKAEFGMLPDQLIGPFMSKLAQKVG